MKNSLFKNKLALRTASFFVLLSITFSLLPLPANAQTTEQPPPPSRQLTMKEKTNKQPARLALVIGNANYENIDKLKNSSADATDMTVALQALGFEVISGIDQNRKQMMTKIREFGDKLNSQKGVGLFFYAGHGVQSNGQNYLVPVDADIPREDEINDSAINIGQVLAKFDTAGADMNIIILDACRNNPFAKEWSEFRAASSGDGIGKIVAPTGTILFYATQPGKAASDGAGRNGLFTEALLENIKKPNLEFDVMAKVVSRRVAEKSKQLQIPYKEGPNYSDFYFAGMSDSNPILPAPVVKTKEAEPEIVEKDAAAVERETWDVVKNSADAEVIRSYLQDFPKGANAAKAKILLEKIVWNSVKTTADKTLVENYLKEFAGGANAPIARAKLLKLESPAKKETAAVEPEKESVAETPAPKPVTPKATTSTRAAKTKNSPAAASVSKFAVRKNSVEMEFVYLPAGNFMMGSSEANVNESYALGRKDYGETERAWFDNEKPQHRVTFADGFWIGKTEVTQAQWTAIMGENPSNNKGCDDCPVERVNWEDAQDFVKKLNEKNDGFEYRLPSEAEWEYAARGGKTGILAGRMEDLAWYNVNSETRTHPVATKAPNAFGLYDMHGNVAEWCEDIFTQNYEGAPVDGTANTTVGDPTRRVLRGGTLNDFPTYLRFVRRDPYKIKLRAVVNGLRVVAVEKQP